MTRVTTPSKGMSVAERRQVAIRACIIAFGILAVFVLTGASVLSLLGMGLAIDYALFVVSRFREELGKLPLGSRPAKRKPNGGVESLRAIPWIFAWTQNRLMLPAWLGWEQALGQALAGGDGELLKGMREHWPFFRTRIDMLEMVLAKADAQIAEAYDERLVQPHLRPSGAHLRDLLSQSCQVVLGLTGQSQLLAHNRETLESISVRNTYLDPLHLLQAELLGGEVATIARYDHPVLVDNNGREKPEALHARSDQLHLLGVGQQRLAGRGGVHRLAAHQQALPQGRFQRLDAQRHRRQREVQRLRGGAEAAVLDHGGQGFELAGVQHVRLKLE